MVAASGILGRASGRKALFSGCLLILQLERMSTGPVGIGLVWSSVLERFERHAPASVMARMAREHALPSGWVDEVFEAHRQRQYSRELLFSTVVELTTVVSLAFLYDKVNHTEPGVLRGDWTANPLLWAAVAGT
jgi:hypothetical protein